MIYYISFMQRIIIIIIALAIGVGIIFFAVRYQKEPRPLLTVSPVYSLKQETRTPTPTARITSTPIPTSTGTPLPLGAISAYALSLESGKKTVLKITGSGFGTPSASSLITLDLKEGTEKISSRNAAVKTWRDNEIVAVLPLTRTSGTVNVTTKHSAFRPAKIEAYLYTSFAIPFDNPKAVGLPISLAVDREGRVWINEEFHRDLHVWEPSTSRARAIPIPRPDEKLFTSVFGKNEVRTGTSGNGEDIMVDPEGKVWFTEGGQAPYGGKYPNHGRLVRYDPRSPEGQRYRVYNLPGDNNQPIGIAFDTKRRRVWFASAERKISWYIVNGKLTQDTTPITVTLSSFDPDRVPYNTGTTIDYSPASRKMVCSDTRNDRCFREYRVPQNIRFAMPGHIAVDSKGDIWFTAYWGGNYIGRLNPETSTFTKYPLPPRRGESNAAVWLGSGPWEVAIDERDNIVVTEFFDSTLTRLRRDRLGAACEKLDSNKKNPCMEEADIPGADMKKDTVHTHTIAKDRRVWFATGSTDKQAQLRMTIGFVNPDWKSVFLFPPLSLLTGREFAGAGIAIDHGRDSDTIWVLETFNKKLARIKRVP